MSTRRFLSSHWELPAAGLLLVAFAATAFWLAGQTGTVASVAPDVRYPHAASCFHPDPVAAPPCRAARELLAGSNDGDARLLCRHRYPRAVYDRCVRLVMFTDPGFSEFQTASFRVRSVLVVIAGEARVRVDVWPFEGGPRQGVFLNFELSDFWWRVTGVAPVPTAVS